jgi:hypothetical protein
VALHFDGRGRDGDTVVVVFTGEARVTAGEPTADRVPAYVEKYAERVARMHVTPEQFAAEYAVTIRVRPARVRGF